MKFDLTNSHGSRRQLGEFYHMSNVKVAREDLSMGGQTFGKCIIHVNTVVTDLCCRGGEFTVFSRLTLSRA